MAEEKELEVCLQKTTKQTSFETVVFVGNGAIERGSNPLRSALDSWIANDHDVPEVVNNFRRQNSEAFHQLAIYSYKYRTVRTLHFKRWLEAKKKNDEKNKIHNTARDGTWMAVRRFLSLRAAIASAYSTQQKELSLRNSPEIHDLIGEEAAYITTNWDNTLWSDKNVKRLIHLHGRCDFEESLVVPTELLVEDTPYDFSIFEESEIKKIGLDLLKEITGAFRFNSINALLAAHDDAIQLTRDAKRVMIWGYSLGDYDADINALIATYTKPEQELIVINTDPYSFQRAVSSTGITNARLYNPLLKSFLKLDSK